MSRVHIDEVALKVACTHDGSPVGPEEAAVVTLRRRPAGVEVTMDAPFHDDPPPLVGGREVPAGRVDGLWNHEVVELFLLGDDDRYLEIEVGPRGHQLILTLHGRRQVVDDRHVLEVVVSRTPARWAATIQVPTGLVPPGCRAANAHAIHGLGAGRRYLSAFPARLPKPDFHQLEAFGPLPVGFLGR